MPGYPDIPSKNIVLVGHFNPAIIQPSFLRRFKILTDQEIAAAEDIFEPQRRYGKLDVKVSRFWISGASTLLIFETVIFDVARDKFIITMRPQADVGAIIDGARRLFTVLQYTPVTALGFNFQAHWRTAEGIKRLQKLFTGDSQLFSKVFPKNQQIGGKVKFADSDLQSQVTLEIEPSVRLQSGVFFNFNFHYEIPDANAEAVATLLPNYDKALTRSHSIMTSLIGRPLESFEFDALQELDESSFKTEEKEKGKPK